MFCKQHLYLHLTHHHVLVQGAFIKNLLADAALHVAATVHFVSQIATAIQNSGNICLVVVLLVAKLAKLNLKELTTLRRKKTGTWDVIAFIS